MNQPNEISLEECEELIRIRMGQHRVNELLKSGKFKNIPIHLEFGYEALALNIAKSNSSNDVLCLSHRNIAHNLAGGASIEKILKSFDLINEPGVNHMGSMNLALDESKVAYTSSILGNNLAVGVGIAMNRKLQGKPGQVVVVTGDGAIEEGIFWESLILARSNNLNLLIVLENNNCSMSSSIRERRFEFDLQSICKGLNILYFKASGASFVDTRNVILEGRKAANNWNPTLVEINLKAFNQHAGPTPGWDTDPLEISLDSGVFMSDQEADPLFQVARSVGYDKFNQLVTKCLEKS